MTILVDQMIAWLEAEKANGQNIKVDGRGQKMIKLTMLQTKKQDAKVSHFFTYDDFEPNKQGGGYQQSSNNVTPMPPIADGDIPF
jgi:hypothetical protein